MASGKESVLLINYNYFLTPVMKVRIIIITILIATIPFNLFSQPRKGFGLDAGMYFNSDQAIGSHYSITYNWLMREYLSLSAGVMFFHIKPDFIEWNSSQGVSYDLDNRVMHFNGIASITFMYPVVNHTGLYLNGSFFFEPVPLDYVSINKNTVNGNQYNSKSIGKFYYSHFAPGVFAEAGIYHDFIKKEKLLKFFLGIGIGWYDVYSVYRHCTLDNQNLSNHIPDEKKYYRISVRLTGF